MNHTYTIFKKIRIKIRRIVRLAKILREEEKEKIPNVTQHCKHRGWLTPRGMGGIYEKNETSLSLSLPIKAGRKERRAKERKREKTATISGSKRIQLTKLGAERNNNLPFCFTWAVQSGAFAATPPGAGWPAFNYSSRVRARVSLGRNKFTRCPTLILPSTRANNSFPLSNRIFATILRVTSL